MIGVFFMAGAGWCWIISLLFTVSDRLYVLGEGDVTSEADGDVIPQIFWRVFLGVLSGLEGPGREPGGPGGAWGGPVAGPGGRWPERGGGGGPQGSQGAERQNRRGSVISADRAGGVGGSV